MSPWPSTRSSVSSGHRWPFRFDLYGGPSTRRSLILAGLPGDYNGDGTTDFAVFRPSNGAWYVALSGGGTTAMSWGTAGDFAVPGDYNGDGKTDFAVFRPSNGAWYVALSGGGTTAMSWGTTGDVPVPGDYNGDGKTDFAVFRPSTTGTWYVSLSGGGTTSASGGTSGDIPVPVVNDAPVVITTASSLAYPAADPPAVIDPGVTVTNARGGNLSSATVRITSGYQNGQDVLSLGAGGPAAVTADPFDAATGTLTLHGPASVADFQAALRQVRYPDTNSNPNTAARTATFAVSDGTLGSNLATKTIAVTAVPPTVTATGSPLAYTENQGAVPIDPGLTVTGPGSPSVQSAKVAITSGFNGAQDALAFTNQSGIIGSYNSTTGVLSLTGPAPISDYQTALRSVTYANNSDNPQSLNRTISFSVVDVGGLTSNIATRGIVVTSVDDPPTNNNVPGSATVAEDTNLAVPAISISDPDADRSPIKVSLDVAHGTLTFATTTGLTFVDGTANGTGSVHVTGTRAAINTALGGLTYRGNLNYNSTQGAEAFTIVTNDQGNAGTGGPLTDTDSFAITVSAVNDAPTAPTQTFSAETNMRRSVTVQLSGPGARPTPTRSTAATRPLSASPASPTEAAPVA